VDSVRQDTPAIDTSPVRRYSSRQRKRVFKFPIRIRIAACRGPIASFKILRDVQFVEELPTTSSGKVQKAKLREVAVHRSAVD
jgi:acyl-CoA synthetase (AMP-forming)/AMP-acid ligase II